MDKTDNKHPVLSAALVSMSTCSCSRSRRWRPVDPQVQEAMLVAIFDLAQPTLAEVVTVEQLLATDDGFDPTRAAEPDDGFVQFRRLGLEPLIG